MARTIYLALDRPDIQLAVKECAVHMATLVGRGWQRFKRLARYLKMHPRLVMMCGWHSRPGAA